MEDQQQPPQQQHDNAAPVPNGAAMRQALILHAKNVVSCDGRSQDGLRNWLEDISAAKAWGPGVTGNFKNIIPILAVGVTVMCFLSNVYLGWTTGRSAGPEDDDDQYFRQLMAQPPPEVQQLPLPQRKLTYVRAQRRPRHMRLYDVHGRQPEERFYNCVQTRTIPQFHVCIYPPTIDKFISAALTNDGVWEPYITPILQRALNKYPDAAFIDVGANIGYYSLLAARMGHHVIAIEPARENVVRLHKGAQLSRVTRSIDVVFTAVSDRHTNLTIVPNVDNQGGLMVKLVKAQDDEQVVGDNSGSSSWASKSSYREPEVLMATTMDHLLEVAEFSQAVIKLDIEGYECKAMAGARRLLSRVYVPYIFMEWNKMYAARHREASPCPRAAIDELTNYLVARGYVPYEVRTGFQLNPARSTTRWRIGDIYWRLSKAKVLQDPY